jgi:hypothetical protein
MKEAMSTDPAGMPSSSSPAAECMRLYRKHRREGMQYVRIPLCATEVQDLIWMGRLDEDQRHDAEAIQTAVLGLFHSAMDEKRRDWLHRAQVPIKARR